MLNRVQGTPYPYFYCVVIAKKDPAFFMAVDKTLPVLPEFKFGTPDSGISAFFNAIGLGTTPDLVFETKEEEDVNILVIRQATSKTSGYHTQEWISRGILERAITIAAAYRELKK